MTGSWHVPRGCAQQRELCGVCVRNLYVRSSDVPREGRPVKEIGSRSSAQSRKAVSSWQGEGEGSHVKAWSRIN